MAKECPEQIPIIATFEVESAIRHYIRQHKKRRSLTSEKIQALKDEAWYKAQLYNLIPAYKKSLFGTPNEIFSLLISTTLHRFKQRIWSWEMQKVYQYIDTEIESYLRVKALRDKKQLELICKG